MLHKNNMGEVESEFSSSKTHHFLRPQSYFVYYSGENQKLQYLILVVERQASVYFPPVDQVTLEWWLLIISVCCWQ